MRPLSKGRVAEKLAQFQTGLRHAFSLQRETGPFSMGEVELMERVAEAIVKRDMAAPATVFLESMGPMSFLGSQALHFLTPIIECAFNAKEVDQVARLLERRNTIRQLIAIIETKSAAKRASAQ
ncbi:MAG: hypothetical protein ACT4O4_00250 [Nitrospiraceae bacterium]